MLNCFGGTEIIVSFYQLIVNNIFFTYINILLKQLKFHIAMVTEL